MNQSEAHYSIGELAELAGVSRRTVHFYVQQGLIEPPQGRGRGSYYTDAHLGQVRRVLALQREGLALRRIQGMSADEQSRATAALPGRQLVLRVAVVPGVTLEIEAGTGGRIPSDTQLVELARCCAALLDADS